MCTNPEARENDEYPHLHLNRFLEICHTRYAVQNSMYYEQRQRHPLTLETVPQTSCARKYDLVRLLYNSFSSDEIEINVEGIEIFFPPRAKNVFVGKCISILHPPTIFRHALVILQTKFRSTSTKTGLVHGLLNTVPNPDRPRLQIAHSHGNFDSRHVNKCCWVITTVLVADGRLSDNRTSFLDLAS